VGARLRLRHVEHGDRRDAAHRALVDVVRGDQPDTLLPVITTRPAASQPLKVRTSLACGQAVKMRS
jgi:hypothetical protein